MKQPFEPRILGLILARGGSKRLPGKNIKVLCGKPLVAWTVEASLACGAICETVVSTDSPAIAEVSSRHGAKVPFIRAASLAGDHSTSADAAIDALDQLENLGGKQFDAVMLLEPTSPLRADGDLPGIAALLTRRWSQADAVVAVGLVHREHPEVMKIRDPDGFLTPWLSGADGAETDRPQPWFPFGGAYAIKVSTLRAGRTFYPPRLLGYPVARWQHYEIDDEVDFICTEAIFKHRAASLASGGTA